jgi:hypothetical protein
MAGSEIKPGERVKHVHFGEDAFSVDLVDGRTITVPYAWFPSVPDNELTKTFGIGGPRENLQATIATAPTPIFFGPEGKLSLLNDVVY